MKEQFASDLDRLISPYISAIADAADPAPGQPEEDALLFVRHINGTLVSLNLEDKSVTTVHVGKDIVYSRRCVSPVSGEYRTDTLRPGDWIAPLVAFARDIIQGDEDTAIESAINAARDRSVRFAPI